MNIKRFTFNPFGESTYLLWDESTGDAAVVDPGMSNEAEQRVFEHFIDDNNLKVRQIINTHMHLDHCWGANWVRNRYGASVAGHKDDAFLGLRAAEQARMFGIGNDFRPVEIDVALADGDVVEVGNCRLEVLAVPGHSPGSIALYDRQGGTVIVGDALFHEAVGRTDLPGGDFQTLMNSIRSKLYTLPDKTRVLSGHEQPTTIGHEKKYNPYCRP